MRYKINGVPTARLCANAICSYLYVEVIIQLKVWICCRYLFVNLNCLLNVLTEILVLSVKCLTKCQEQIFCGVSKKKMNTGFGQFIVHSLCRCILRIFAEIMPRADNDQ
uniref:Uncharacterized protein n=1 Tax=Arundo donax TaxID=35708 RepID=A0A0A9CL39_ARUDO